MTATVTLPVGPTVVKFICHKCSKTFQTRHRCKVNGARYRIGKTKIVVRGAIVITVAEISRYEVP